MSKETKLDRCNRMEIELAALKAEIVADTKLLTAAVGDTILLGNYNDEHYISSPPTEDGVIGLVRKKMAVDGAATCCQNALLLLKENKLIK